MLKFDSQCVLMFNGIDPLYSVSQFQASRLDLLKITHYLAPPCCMSLGDERQTLFVPAQNGTNVTALLYVESIGGINSSLSAAGSGERRYPKSGEVP